MKIRRKGTNLWMNVCHLIQRAQNVLDIVLGRGGNVVGADGLAEQGSLKIAVVPIHGLQFRAANAFEGDGNAFSVRLGDLLDAADRARLVQVAKLGDLHVDVSLGD